MTLHRRQFGRTLAGLGLLSSAMALRAQPAATAPSASAAASTASATPAGTASAPPTAELGPPLEPPLRERARHAGMGYAAMRVTPAGVLYGFAGRRSSRDETAPTASDCFEIGSITKTFTALLLADAVLKRELTLDDPVEAALGQRLRDAEGQPLRWRDLATHRSGLPRLPGNFAPARSEDPYADYTEASLRAFLDRWRADVPRDRRWTYSNLGFGLLGLALGRALGTPYPALLETRVLKPLGLQDLRLSLTQAPDTRVLPGHNEQGQPLAAWTFDTLAPAGGLVGPVTALARYAQAALGLFDHPLAPAFALCLQRHADGGTPVNQMGLGWILGTVRGRPFATHDGSTYGFASSIFLEPPRRHATAVLANARGGVGDLALHLIDPVIPPRNLVAEREAREQAALTLPADQLQPLTGTYALSPQFKLTLRLDGARLMAQATGQGAFELFARTPREFFARVTPLRIRFEGAEGPPAALLLDQAGQTLRFVRE